MQKGAYNVATLPFTEDIEPLLKNMDSIPIDDNVPFADGFKKVMEAYEGNPWGPQANPRSKLATRLHFAGWSRQELESVGLKPKDAENFRSKHKLTLSRSGRPRNPSLPVAQKLNLFEAKAEVEPIEAIHTKCAKLNDLIASNKALIEEAQRAIEEAEIELKKQEVALKVLSS